VSAPDKGMLMAYADGRLTPDEALRVETWLKSHPEDAAEVTLWMRQNDAIRTLFAPVASEPVPARLRPARIAAEIGARQARSWRWAAAAVLLLGIGLGAGWAVRPLLETAPPASQMLIADAVNAHRVFAAESRHAVEVVAAEEDHLVTWLSNRLATPVGTPDLSGEGFFLVGGRLLPGEADIGGRAAQLMYENGAKERITIYVTAALPDHEPAYRLVSHDGAEAFYWADARITCTVVGTLPEDRMKTLSQAVYSQLAGTQV